MKQIEFSGGPWDGVVKHVEDLLPIPFVAFDKKAQKHRTFGRYVYGSDLGKMMWEPEEVAQ